LRPHESHQRHRMEVARRYYDGIRHPEIWLPSRPDKEEENVWHIFPVFTERRDELQAYLKDKEIQTLIHYPIPPHKQKCYPEWHTLSLPVTEKIHSCELSLPISPVITDEEADRVISAINSFPLTI
nr:DegT/DnrJ/EryC1/StrS family aminotransferase [Muribaculaceae bacterium]